MKSMMLFSSDKKVARFLEKTFKKIIGHVADLYSSSLEDGVVKALFVDRLFRSDCSEFGKHLF